MSVDMCFWQRADGAVRDLYASAADGIGAIFESDSAVLDFRERLIQRWPDIEHSLEPPSFDPDLEEQEDLSRFILITLHANDAYRYPEIIEMARSFGLSGYDPQTDAEIP